jgi:hypothetical protein
MVDTIGSTSSRFVIRKIAPDALSSFASTLQAKTCVGHDIADVSLPEVS